MSIENKFEKRISIEQVEESKMTDVYDNLVGLFRVSNFDC